MIETIKIHFPGEHDVRRWDFSFSAQGTMRLPQVFKKGGIPEWVKLETYQCPACTLKPESSPVCPVAQVMAKYAYDLADRQSHETVNVEIIQKDSEPFMINNVSLQRVVGELVRLGAFQYECPVGRKIKQPMTELPPFPSSEEILSAFTRAFADHQSDEGGFEKEHTQLLEDLHDLFGNITLRLDQVGQGDAHLNGVVILHSLSMLFSLSAPELVRKFNQEKQNNQEERQDAPADNEEEKEQTE